MGLPGLWSLFNLHTSICPCCREETMPTTLALLPRRRWETEGSSRGTATSSRRRARQWFVVLQAGVHTISCTPCSGSVRVCGVRSQGNGVANSTLSLCPAPYFHSDFHTSSNKSRNGNKNWIRGCMTCFNIVLF